MEVKRKEINPPYDIIRVTLSDVDINRLLSGKTLIYHGVIIKKEPERKDDEHSGN